LHMLGYGDEGEMEEQTPQAGMIPGTIL
jgi:hypothetical protein